MSHLACTKVYFTVIIKNILLNEVLFFHLSPHLRLLSLCLEVNPKSLCGIDQHNENYKFDKNN